MSVALTDPAADLPDPPEADVTPESEALFVCAVDLPTASLSKARAAVALQLDLLSPLPVAEVVSSVVMLGPVEGGLTRFAVGLAPRELFAAYARAGARGPAALRLAGRLDEQLIAFRFDNPHRAEARARAFDRRLSATTVALAVLAVLLGGLSLRLQRENDAAQERADATATIVQQRVSETRGGGATGWLSARAANAPLVECALKAVAGAGAEIADLTVADGAATVTFARPLGPDAAAALPRSAQPVAADTGVTQVRIASGACR